MSTISNSILMFSVLLINFIFWDYLRSGTIMWEENIWQSLSFVILFRIFSWLVSSTKNDKKSRDSKGVNYLKVNVT